TAQDGPPAHLGGYGRARGGRGARAEPTPDRPPRRGSQDCAGADRRAPHRPRPAAPAAFLRRRGRQRRSLRRSRAGQPTLQPRPLPRPPALQGAHGALPETAGGSRKGRLTMDHIYVEENQIADRYVKGTLPAEEAERFENHYLSCPECLDRLELAESVQRGFKRMAG